MMSEVPKSKEQEAFQTVWAKRLFAASLVLLGIVLTLQGMGIIQSPEAKRKPIKAKPVYAGGLRCDVPVWDFGSIDSVKNPKISHEYTLVNESKETVAIRKIHSSCGCMVAEGYDTEVQSGQSTKIKVVVQLPSTPGPFAKTLAIQTSGGVMPLNVVGETEANSSLYCVPATVNFGIIRPGETKAQIVQVLRHDLSPVDFSGVSCSSITGISCVPENRELKTTLLIKLTESDQLPHGRFEGRLTLRTNNEFNPSMIIPLFGKKVMFNVADE